MPNNTCSKIVVGSILVFINSSNTYNISCFILISAKKSSFVEKQALLSPIDFMVTSQKMRSSISKKKTPIEIGALLGHLVQHASFSLYTYLHSSLYMLTTLWRLEYDLEPERG